MDEKQDRQISTRMKIAALVLTWVLIFAFQAYWFKEPARMTAAKERQRSESVARGLVLYAQNCSVCHGPEGEGVVGPPLQRDEWRTVSDSEMSSAADFIRKTVTRGRPGQTNTTWTFLPNGYIQSQTAMPTWGRADGGPLNQQMIDDIVNFIQYGDFKQVWQHVKTPVNLDQKLPRPDGMTEAEVAKAEEVIRSKNCLQCHKMGRVGASTGPDLSTVGSWADNQAELQDLLNRWLKDPASVEKRAPQFWSTMNLTDDPMKLNPEKMPKIPMTDQERQIIVNYLLHLKE